MGSGRTVPTDRVCDIRDEAMVQSAVAQTVERFGASTSSSITGVAISHARQRRLRR